MIPNRIPLQTILAAKSGDSEALAEILKHYASYIASFSKRPFFDETGNQYDIIDEEIRQQIESKLILQILYKFDPEKLPKGESISPE